jgi:MFS family permease
VNFIQFVRENLRWLAGGFLLTLFSSFGQTFFIALSAGDIRAEYGLSHGQWGSLYMLATLCSALSLPFVGQSVDRHAIWKVALAVILALSVACLAMSYAHHIALLAISVFALRLFGQGMMTHTAIASMGKWFAARRGRAVSIASIGVNFGEASLPLLFVALSAAVGWRNSWILAAALLVIFALPAICMLMARERQPRSEDPELPASTVADWTRAQVLADPLFYLLLVGILAPPFIGTTIFFHQVHLVEIRGWSLQVFAASFSLMSAMVIACALIAGQLVDRYSAVRMLPVFLVPLSAACLVLGSFEGQWSAFVFMALLGISYGFSTTIFGAVWPEVYGTAHLGSVRATIVAIMVFATAAGPGITGVLIDLGVSYPLQIQFMGIYCLLAIVMMVFVSGRIMHRNGQPETI